MSRALRHLVKWSYLICALLLILLAVLVQSGRSFSHLLGDYDQDIAHYLSQKFNAQVDIGHIAAAWDGLKPSLDIRQFSMHSHSGKPIVALERARVRLDILGSLSHRRWVWSSIQLGDVQLEFQQLESGKWHISGLPRQVEQSSAPHEAAAPNHASLDRLIDMLLLSSRIEFDNSQLNFTFSNGEQISLAAPMLLLENSGDFHRLALQVDVGAQARSAYLLLEGHGDPRKRQQFRSSGYVQLNQFPTGEPVAALSAFLLGGVAAPLRSEGWVNANLWLDKAAGDNSINIRGDMALERLFVPLAERQVQLDGVHTHILGQWRYGGDWQLQLRDMQAQFKARALPAANLGMDYVAQQQQLALHIDKVELEPLSALLEESGSLGQGRLLDVFAHTQPRGQLLNAQLALPLTRPQDWQLRANLNDAAIGAWQGVPALTGVNGYLLAHRLGGHVDLESRQGFSMHYANTFAEPMAYDSARGQVAWYLDKDHNSIHVNSGLLQLRQGAEQVNGYFWLHLPWQRNSGDIDLYIQAGGRHLNASLYRKYLPQQVPDTLRQWLAASVGADNPGMARTAGFVYRGTLNTPNPMARSFDLNLDVAGARLSYSSDWPVLEQLDGRLLVSNGQVLANVTSAQMLDSQLSQAQITFAPRHGAKGQLLSLQGQLQGPALDGLRLLREGALRRQLGSALDSWNMLGELTALVDLAIPMGGAPASAARQRVEVQLDAPVFTLQNLQLNFQDLQGRIHYDNDTGLSSEGLQASLFGEPVSAQLDTRKHSGFNETLIDLAGRVDAAALANWSKRPELLFFKGAIPYQTRVTLNHRRPAQTLADIAALDEGADVRQRFAAAAFAKVEVRSDLQQVALALPDALGKEAASQRPLAVDLWLQEREILLDIRYNQSSQQSKPTSRDWIDALFLLERGGNSRLLNASVALAEVAQFSPQPRFRVQGYMAEFQLDAWRQLLTRYEHYQTQLGAGAAPGSASAPQAEGMIAGLPISAQLLLGRYQLGALELQDLAVQARRDWRGWHLRVDNPSVAGDILVPVKAGQALDAKLDYLHLSRAQMGLPEPKGGDVPENSGLESSGLEGRVVEGRVVENRATTKNNSVPGDAQALPSLRNILDPRDLPRATIAVGKLSLAGEDYGSWSLSLNPKPQGVVIDHIKGQLRGLTIEGTEVADEGAQILWLIGDQGPQTRFVGTLRAGDMGEVMRQWGKPEMLESQAARFNLDIYWDGSPQDFKLQELDGSLGLSMEKGRFKRNASAGDGVLRLLSVLNFDSLARRMRLDFSDLYQSGLAYDQVQGQMSFHRGTLVFDEPLEVIGPSSRLQMVGSIDLKRERVRTRLVATLPVAGNLTFFAALVTGLPAAAGIYIVSKLFKKQVDQVTSISYRISGSWDNPKMRFDRFFESENSLRGTTQKPVSLRARPEDITPDPLAREQLLPTEAD